MALLTSVNICAGRRERMRNLPTVETNLPLSNWNDTLQNLRVIHTGTQIIRGFLVTLKFGNRFTGSASSDSWD